MSAFVSFVELSRRWAQERPHKVAYAFLRDGQLIEDSITYAELDRRACRLAALLQRTVEPGARALLLFPSGIDFIVAFVACLYAGVVAVPTNNPRPKKLHWQRIEAIVRDAGVTVVLTTLDNLERNRGWLVEDETFGKIPRLAVDAIVDGSPVAWQKLEAAPERLAFLQYTSGSTGTPKGVMVGHGNLIHNSGMIRDAFGHDDKTVIVSWLPLFHDLGLIGNVLQTLFVGATCYLMTPVAFLQQPFHWLRAISLFRGNSGMAPNFAYERLIAQVSPQEKASLDLSCWNLALNGAEPIRIDTVERFEREFSSCGFQPLGSFPAYGLAECTLIAATSDKTSLVQSMSVDVHAFREGRVVERDIDDGASIRLASSGKPRNGLRIVVVHPETLVGCEPGLIGEIWIHGDSVCQGYWQRPEESERTFSAHTFDGVGPFLRTGDLGFIDGDDLYITGRLKELVIIRGQNFFPQDMEHAIQQSHPALRDDCGAAFSVDVEDEERVVLVQEIERTHLRQLNGDDVCRAIRRSLADGFELHAHAIVLIKPATLPKTSSGKIQRRLCKEQFERGELGGEVFRSVQVQQPPTEAASVVTLAKRTDADEVRTWIILRLARYLSVLPDAIDGDTAMADFGLDSSVAVSFAGEIGRWIGREQDPSLLWMYPTVDTLLAHVLCEVEASACAEA